MLMVMRLLIYTNLRVSGESLIFTVRENAYLIMYVFSRPRSWSGPSPRRGAALCAM